jgi:hypothetical protein
MDVNSKPGYVYVLEARDIELPICKIGMTTREPEDRCLEINKGSTGDLLWTISYALKVSDCQALETAVHCRLQNFRQPGREFFQLTPAQAKLEIHSTLDGLAHISELSQPTEEDKGQTGDEGKSRKVRKRKKRGFRQADTEYADLLQAFSFVLGVKGRPFGQLNRRIFGVSDGVEGVQWNLAVHTDTGVIRLGVNLEGLQYDRWPIATFILNELQHPKLEAVQQSVHDPDAVKLRFRRDAWQVASRPRIIEQQLGGDVLPLSKLNPQRWKAVLEEALGCLDAERDYRGRAHQEVTLPANREKPDRRVVMPVSPHLTVWTHLSVGGDHAEKIKSAMELLQPVHEWVERQSDSRKTEQELCSPTS